MVLRLRRQLYQCFIVLKKKYIHQTRRIILPAQVIIGLKRGIAQ